MTKILELIWKELKSTHFFASLHDIGKIGVPFELLKKKDKLEKEALKTKDFIVDNVRKKLQKKIEDEYSRKKERN